MSKARNILLVLFPTQSDSDDPQKRKKTTFQSTHVCSRKWHFASGRPFVFSEPGTAGLGNVRRNVGAAADVNLLSKQERGS